MLNKYLFFIRKINIVLGFIEKCFYVLLDLKRKLNLFYRYLDIGV